jgi:hypothetical protein
MLSAITSSDVVVFLDAWLRVAGESPACRCGASLSADVTKIGAAKGLGGGSNCGSVKVIVGGIRCIWINVLLP